MDGAVTDGSITDGSKGKIPHLLNANWILFGVKVAAYTFEASLRTPNLVNTLPPDSSKCL